MSSKICSSKICTVLAILLPLLILASCIAGPQTELPRNAPTGDEVIDAHWDGGYEGTGDEDQEGTGDREQGAGDREQGAGDGDARRIRIVTATGEEIWNFTEDEISALPSAQSGSFVHVYSTINNWPTARFYVASGYSVECILRIAGVLDSAQTVTFRAADGYEISLTHEQLLSEQYYFPQVGDSADDAEPVTPIIAFRWREGTADINDLREDKPALILGQRNFIEHTNPAYVIDIAEIVVDTSPCEAWEKASTFPPPGQIAEGETVKLQHQSFGLVKLHYTLDGSDPTRMSPMYNPSTYQPELNVPIPITEPTIIKVLVTGYGKNDSEIAVFEFEPVP